MITLYIKVRRPGERWLFIGPKGLTARKSRAIRYYDPSFNARWIAERQPFLEVKVTK